MFSRLLGRPLCHSGDHFGAGQALVVQLFGQGALGLGQQIQEASSDYLKLQDLCQQRDALEEEILKLYGTWERLSAELEEAKG